MYAHKGKDFGLFCFSASTIYYVTLGKSLYLSEFRFLICKLQDLYKAASKHSQFNEFFLDMPVRHVCHIQPLPQETVFLGSPAWGSHALNATMQT